jgi:cytidylate kinase
MNTTEKFVITINRELGSGGRTVGERLAKELGVSFYDKALIHELRKKFNLTTEEIERLKAQKNDWWSEFKRMIVPMNDIARSQFYTFTPYGEPELLTTNDMFKAEVLILENIAHDESCVIAGRSGFYVFRNHPNHLSVLIQAPLEDRINRLSRKHPEKSRKELEEIIKNVDQGRENYVNRYTESSRYDTRNYDLVINMHNLSEDDALQIILNYLERSRG